MKKKLLMVLTSLLCAFCMVFSFAACGSNESDNSNDSNNSNNQTNTTVAVESVKLNKNELTLDLSSHKSETLTATVTPENATDKTVTWSVAPAGVVTVAGGVVTAVAAGEAKITATAGSKSDTCSVKVTPAAVAVESVVISPKTLTLTLGGGSQTLTATVSPENATDKTVSWSVEPKDVVKVEDGVVTPLKPGTATITAAAGGKSDTCSVEVTPATVAVESVEISPKPLILTLNGGSQTLTATVLPADAMYESVEWTVEPNDVVTVEDGVVTPLKEGKATVTATAGDKSDTCLVVVNPEPPTPTASLKYTLQSDGTYWVARTGNQNTTVTDIVIASTYNDKPVTGIEDRAFQNNTSIKSVYIPGSVKKIGGYVFTGCSNLQSATICYGVEYLGTWVFRNCSSLQSISLPDSVTTLMGDSFYGCSSLESVKLSSGLTEIKGSTFYGCTKLKSIVIPEGVTSFYLATMVFQGCTALEELILPSTLKTVYGNDSFSGDKKLITVSYNGTVEEWKALDIDWWLSNPYSYVQYVKCTDGTYSLETKTTI